MKGEKRAFFSDCCCRCWCELRNCWLPGVLCSSVCNKCLARSLCVGPGQLWSHSWRPTWGLAPFVGAGGLRAYTALAPGGEVEKRPRAGTTFRVFGIENLFVFSTSLTFVSWCFFMHSSLAPASVFRTDAFVDSLLVGQPSCHHGAYRAE